MRRSNVRISQILKGLSKNDLLLHNTSNIDVVVNMQTYVMIIVLHLQHLYVRKIIKYFMKSTGKTLNIIF